jgi:hypothetical protein
VNADPGSLPLDTGKEIHLFRLFFWFFEARNADPEITPLTI